VSIRDLLPTRVREDVRIEVPGVELVFNHRLKIAVLYTADSDTKDDTFAALEGHLNRQGYVLQIIVAPIGMSRHRPSIVDPGEAN
jgi:hypothetical protein